MGFAHFSLSGMEEIKVHKMTFTDEQLKMLVYLSRSIHCIISIGSSLSLLLLKLIDSTSEANTSTLSFDYRDFSQL